MPKKETELMTKVILSEDSGNSPKNILVQKVTVALASGDSRFIISHVTEDVRWDILGDRLIEGKDRFAEALDEMKKRRVKELIIRHIATHGRTGAVDGTLRFEDGMQSAFCNVYEFSNSKGSAIKEITSYVIDIN